MSPLPNEHSCRLRAPEDFEKGSFRRIERGEGENRLAIIIGRLKGQETTTTQAYRYDKEIWSEARASAHCEEQRGQFEPATKEAKAMIDRYFLTACRDFVDENKLQAVATTGRINRFDEELPASALKTTNYLKNPVVLWAHNWSMLPIGKTDRLWVEGEELSFEMSFAQHEQAQLIKGLYKGGFLNAFSVGFVIRDYKSIKRGEKTVRRITDAELLEISSVIVPADAGALQEAGMTYYSLGEVAGMGNTQFYKAIPYKKTPLAGEGEDWDAGAEVREATVEDLMAMCAWYDAEFPNIKESYKLPHHKAAAPNSCIWRAVAAAAAVIMGARGGVEIPDADMPGVKAHIAHHYEDFDKGEPPWEAATMTKEDASLWGASTRRLQHIAAELRAGKRHSEADMAMLREVINIATKLLVTEDDLVGKRVNLLSSQLGKEPTGEFWVEFDKLVDSRMPVRLDARSREIVTQAIKILEER